MASPTPEGLKRLTHKLRERYADPTRHPQWTGGRIKRSGYWYVKRKDHPHGGKQGYVAEHRLVMEEKIGRYLKPEEVVHHINGDRADNRLENLQLFESHGQHTKQAHPEVAEAAKSHMRGVKPPNYAQVAHFCGWCRSKFLANPNRQRRYCSRPCYWKAKAA